MRSPFLPDVVKRRAAAGVLAIALGAASALPAATLQLASGEKVEGEVPGYLVFRSTAGEGVVYTLVRGERVTKLDGGGVRFTQPPAAAGRAQGSRGSVVKLLLGSVSPERAVEPHQEAALLSAAVSDDLKRLMEGLMAFRVETGSAVDQSEDFALTSVDGAIYGFLDPAAPAVSPNVSVKTHSGNRVIAVADLAKARDSP